MKVVEKEKQVEKIEFAELKIGQVFKYLPPYWDNCAICMKIYDDEEEDNAVVLADGRCVCVGEYDICIPVEAELVVYS